jgi:hypothetical protein
MRCSVEIKRLSDNALHVGGSHEQQLASAVAIAVDLIGDREEQRLFAIDAASATSAIPERDEQLEPDLRDATVADAQPCRIIVVRKRSYDLRKRYADARVANVLVL